MRTEWVSHLSLGCTACENQGRWVGACVGIRDEALGTGRKGIGSQMHASNRGSQGTPSQRRHKPE